jgi:uncharacterized tellurite resistance protein B-like protein
MSICDWLGLRKQQAEGPGCEVARRIVRELDSMEPGAARHVALFALLLARVANVDLDVSEEETEAMERIVECVGELPATQATLVVAIAKAQHRLFGETHGFLAARNFRDTSTEPQRRDLIHCLFAVAAADGTIDVPEEETIREISRELLIPNDEYLAIRSAYREKRSVFRH